MALRGHRSAWFPLWVVIGLRDFRCYLHVALLSLTPLSFAIWKKCYMQCGVWNQMKCEDHIFICARIISSFDFKHRTAYNISFIWQSFHGKTWAQRIDLLSTVWLHSSVGLSTAPASQRSWVRIPLSHLNFSGSWDNCPASARIISSFDFKHRTAYNISFIF